MVGKVSKKSTVSGRKTSSSKSAKKVSSKKIESDISNIISSTKKKPSNLAKLEKESKSVGGDLMNHMDEVVGLPPLPGQAPSAKKIVKESVKTTVPHVSKEELENHKSDFFEKILGDNAKDKTPASDLKAEQSSKLPPMPKKLGKLAKPEDIMNSRKEISKTEDVKINSAASQDVLEAIKKDAEKFNELHKEALGISMSDGPEESDSTEKELDVPSINSNPNNTDLKVDSKFTKEEPYDEYRENLKETEIAHDKERSNSKDVPSLPPANNQYKLEEKKSFFGKLFGSKSKPAKAPGKIKVPKPKVLKVNPKDYIGVVDDHTIADIADGKNPAIEKEVPTKDDFKDLPTVQSKTADTDEAKTDIPKTEEVKSEPVANDLEADIASGTSMPTLYSDDDKAPAQNIPVISSKPSIKKEDSDSSEEESDEFIESHQVKSKTSSGTSQKSEARMKSVINISISKLEHKKDELEASIAELKVTHSDLDKRSKDVSTKETELDKREKGLLEREDILLTLQSDIIKERKDLDEREFKLYMDMERSTLSPIKAPKSAVLRDIKEIPQGMSPERARLEKLMNAVTTLASNKQLKEAMSTYNQLVEEYRGIEMVPEEKWHVNLAIKELYHDINMLVTETASSESSNQASDKS